ncbi:MAG: formate dehydrogenase accessory sulfurtransferase FdhD [Myxococcales bacterium]|nr:formate dehydrogenase accessory sulfurtransferase FdhD [Myxococcales bacterium]
MRVGTRDVGVTLERDGAWSSGADRVVVEEPLEIRIAGDAVAVTMRTPGHDEDLVLGFLRAEGIVRTAADVGSVVHCGRPGDDGYGNVIDVTPGPGVALDWEKHAVRRGGLTSSACGVCGRRTIDDLLARIAPVPSDARVPGALIAHAMAHLRASQRLFRATGGLHGAVAVAGDGTLLAAAEDVGRHNAVDKVSGALLRRGEDAPLLAVSGRIGFEIVQKAAAARFVAVAGVSAPSSLAIDLAERTGMVLAGFVRDGRMNVYAGRERIDTP